MEVFRLLFNFLFLLPFIKAQDYNVINFGAVGDGNTDDTQAVRAAMAAANHSHGGRVIFDAGYTFLTGCFNISSNVILDVRGKILGSINASNYEIIPLLPFYGNDTHDGGGYTNGMTKQPLVYSYNANNITITGGGVIDGNGPYWYDCRYKDQPPCAPYGR
uniref:Pectate lyase superfamily protein domain-containing protein n=1 Tax=Acrobeloides nanus TaxID=290746 RepID=A0A914BUG1_9BILA